MGVYASLNQHVSLSTASPQGLPPLTAKLISVPPSMKTASSPMVLVGRKWCNNPFLLFPTLAIKCSYRRILSTTPWLISGPSSPDPANNS